MKSTEFYELIKDQFQYGGKKYGLTSTRESTDVLFDEHGKNWLFGTIDKYTYRFTNLKREKDLLKIATYMYILWLKRGFHIDDKRTVPVDTNITIKSKFFDTFIERFEKYFDSRLVVTIEHPDIEDISKELKIWSMIEWKELRESVIFRVFRLSYFLWKEKYEGIKEHDKDTEKEHERK